MAGNTMRRLHASLAAALVLLVAAASAQEPLAQPPLCQRLQDAGSAYHSVYLCLGVPKWALVPSLWTPLSLQVNCTAPTYEIFTAPSWEELQDAAQPVRWCGLAHFSQPEFCRFQVSPFEDVYVGIKTKAPGLLQRIGSGLAPPPEPQCSFAARRDLSLSKVALMVLGVVLFSQAHALTASSTFRLGAGTLTFMSGAALVIAFVLMRNIPYKKRLAAAVVVSASSVAAAARWAYGTWAPDAVAILTSRGAIIYFLVTGLLGLAVTYWFDDTANVKLNNTVCAVLHLSGLLLVYLGTTSEPASLAAIALLVAARVLAPIARRVPGAVRWVSGRLTSSGAKAGRAQPRRRQQQQQLEGDEDVGEAPTPTAAGMRRRPVVVKSPAHELLLSEDEEQERREEARRLRREQEQRRLRETELRRQRELEDEGQRERLARESIDGQPGSLSVWLNGGVKGAAALQAERRPQQQQQQQAWQWPSARGEAAVQQQAKPAVPPAPQAAAAAAGGRGGGWFGRWSNQEAAAPAPAAAAAPAEAATPAFPTLQSRIASPKPSSEQLRQRQRIEEDERRRRQERQQQLLQQQQRRERERQQQEQRRKSSLLYEDDESEEDADGEEEEEEGAPPQRSPWSQERLVVDLNKAPGAAGAGAARAKPGSGAATPRRGAAAAGAGTRTPPAAGARATPTTPRGGAAGGGGDDGDVSPLVRMGKIFNSESSRVIQIGKGKYEELVSKGYTPDFKNGVLLPPGEGGGSGGGGAAAAGGGGGKPRAARAGSRRGE